MSLCDTCILNGRCGDTDDLFYTFEEENDNYDEETSEENY